MKLYNKGKICLSVCALLLLLLTAAFTCLAQETALQEGLSLKYLVKYPASKASHPPVIILLHGYGSDEKDLFGLGSSFPGSYLVISARAPYALPTGGYQWYEKTTIDGHSDIKKEQLTGNSNTLSKFIDEIVARYNADPRQVYVMGFSQGAIMSYLVGLTAPEKVKGIGVLSGMIMPGMKPMVKNNASLKKLRIFISHGTADDRIPFIAGMAASNYLKGLGLNPEFHQYPDMGHTISKEVMTDLVKWVQ